MKKFLVSWRPDRILKSSILLVPFLLAACGGSRASQVSPNEIPELESRLESEPGNGPLPEDTAGFVEERVCLDPALATQPQELVFTMQRSGTCTMTFPEEKAFIDNVRIVTDAACLSE